MSTVDRLTELAKQLVEMGVEFKLFKEQVLRLQAQESELRERVARLEVELASVKREAATEARSAAHAGVYQLQSEITERITRMEERLGQGGRGRITEGDS